MSISTHHKEGKVGNVEDDDGDEGEVQEARAAGYGAQKGGGVASHIGADDERVACTKCGMIRYC